MLASLILTDRTLCLVRKLKWPDGSYVVRYYENGTVRMCGLPVRLHGYETTPAEERMLADLKTWKGPNAVLACLEPLCGVVDHARTA